MGDNNNSPILLTTISGNGSYTYSGADKGKLTTDNFFVCIKRCDVSQGGAVGFGSTDLATKSYNPSTGVLTLSNMVRWQGGGSVQATWTFKADVFLVK